MSGPPESDGAKATPIGRKREFISAAAPSAAPSVPPAPMIPSAAICAEPAKTIALIRIAVQPGMPTSPASTPKDIASTLPASANGEPGAQPVAERRLHAAVRLRLRSRASSLQGRVLATCSRVSQARRAVATP